MDKIIDILEYCMDRGDEIRTWIDTDHESPRLIITSNGVQIVNISAMDQSGDYISPENAEGFLEGCVFMIHWLIENRKFIEIGRKKGA